MPRRTFLAMDNCATTPDHFEQNLHLLLILIYLATAASPFALYYWIYSPMFPITPTGQNVHKNQKAIFCFKFLFCHIDSSYSKHSVGYLKLFNEGVIFFIALVVFSLYTFDRPASFSKISPTFFGILLSNSFISISTWQSHLVYYLHYIIPISYGHYSHIVNFSISKLLMHSSCTLRFCYIKHMVAEARRNDRRYHYHVYNSQKFKK